ncbi:MAG: hypothetical protein ACTSVD_04615 [Candidatus Thorarchaeota archaeon]|nr:MAG: hypothetical protein DRO73_07490 [Candidatus Thorarchaeota archaeon]RLI60547.1 MAG: hypothetical protein DRO93_06770 [Candidatus Thorarchaeota archaeon]
MQRIWVLQDGHTTSTIEELSPDIVADRDYRGNPGHRGVAYLLLGAEFNRLAQMSQNYHYRKCMI